MNDLAAFRNHFAALSNKAYFNYGGQGAMPKEAISAILGGYDFVQTVGPFSVRIFEWLQREVDETKDALAAELGASRRSIVLTGNVSEGCNIAMWGINWQAGDHLLITDSEHKSIFAIADQIARRMQVQVTRLPLMDVNASEKLEELVASHIKERTRLVVLSHVLWNTGRLLDLSPLIRLCRERGVPLLVDGAQSAGVLPLNLRELGVDFYAMTGHKWMCGPEGIGALYIREELLGVLEPTYVGWRGPEMGSQNEPDGSRFEVATSPFPLLAGLRQALALHNCWGSPQARYEQIRRNAAYLRDRLQTIRSVKLVCPRAEDSASLIAFAVDGMKPSAVVRLLEDAGVFVRSIPAPQCVRASVHYFTSEEEIDKLIRALRNGVS